MESRAHRPDRDVERRAISSAAGRGQSGGRRRPGGRATAWRGPGRWRPARGSATYGSAVGEPELIGDVTGDAPGRSAQPVLAGVDEDPVEPGLEPIGVAEGRPLPPRLDERVVGRVLASVGRAGSPAPADRRRRGARRRAPGTRRPPSARTAPAASLPVMSTASPAVFMSTRRPSGRKPSNEAIPEVGRPADPLSASSTAYIGHPAAPRLDAAPPEVDADAEGDDHHEREDRRGLVDQGGEDEHEERDPGRGEGEQREDAGARRSPCAPGGARP